MRLPNSVFSPYTSIGTNLLFFEKGEPTKDIWYWEHLVPNGQKAYSKTKPIRLEYLNDCVTWWGGTERKGRQESERAWKVSVEEIKARGYNLDIKNPHTEVEDYGDPEILVQDLTSAEDKVISVRNQLKTGLGRGPIAVNTNRFLALYDRVSDTADAVDRLRRFVLDLAMLGILVGQDPADESASTLLALARCNLQDRASSAKRARWKITKPVAPEEIKRKLPPRWVAARLNDTGFYVNGLAFKPIDWKQSGIPIIRIQNLTDPTKEHNFAEGTFPDEVLVRTGDLLVSWSATIETFRWDRGESVLNQHIFRVIPEDSLTTRDFLFLLLKKAVREMANSEHVPRLGHGSYQSGSIPKSCGHDSTTCRAAPHSSEGQ